MPPSVRPCRGRVLTVLGLALIWTGAVGAGEPDPALLTVAERSSYRATARSAEVAELMARIASRTEHVRVIQFGESGEGRPLLAAIVAQPPVIKPTELARDARLPILLLGGIHSGECAGKEALLILLRELAADPGHRWLERLIFVVVPNFNPDGNDRVAVDNRPGQVGPEAGMGVRTNAQGLDLNRDWMKLEAPETRALVRLLADWNPYLFLDTHTTNGSHHRYVLTYDAPHNLAAPPQVRELLGRRVLSEVTQRLGGRGFATFYYGNFNKAHTQWTTYGDLPRYSTEYCGLRGRPAILAEAYSYATYRQRIEATRAFVEECVDYVDRNAKPWRELVDGAAASLIARGDRPDPRDRVVLRSEIVAADQPVVVQGFREPAAGLSPPETPEPADYTVDYVGVSRPLLQVTRPGAYLVPPLLTTVIDTLHNHGIRTEFLASDARLPVETYRTTVVQRAERAYQGHRAVTIDVAKRSETRTVPAGTCIVRLGQPLGNLIVHLLEPQAPDGLAAWNFLDADLEVGRDYPILRLVEPGLLPAPATKD